MSNTAMEYSGGLMEMYITENTNRMRELVKDIRDGHMAHNIAENG
jgi:ketol-acid reductoisomerase